MRKQKSDQKLIFQRRFETIRCQMETFRSSNYASLENWSYNQSENFIGAIVNNQI